MQELKVRAYFEHDPKDVYEGCPLKYMEYYELFPAYQINTHEIVEAKDVMLWIGKQDKNGKDIYEGDILEFDNLSHNKVIGNVEWCDFFLQWQVILKKGHKYKNPCVGFIPLCFIQNPSLIGNIYENPELLE
jgi:uncharacterized phage protein (TIGR01671 family)